MIFNRNSKDVSYSYDGDLIVSSEGRIRTSTIRDNNLLKENIAIRLGTQSWEWNQNFVQHADLKDYLGLDIYSGIEEKIRNSILLSLLDFNLFEQQEIKVSEALQYGTNLIFFVEIVSADPDANDLFLNISIDTRDNGTAVKFLDEKAFS